MSFIGYYQRPTIWNDTLVFAFEDDLWLRDLSSASSHAYRLTASPGRSTDPQLSPDGNHLAYTSLDEGSPEIYQTGIEAMEPQRLTYLGEDTRCVGWSRNGADIIFTSNAGAAFARIFSLAKVSRKGGPCQALNIGPAAHISFSAQKGQVIGRHTWDPARWKRYRGGTAGQLWIDKDETGAFERLIRLEGNLTRPLWVGSRIYFGSDHEGICNIYSCTPEGADLRRHSEHDSFYIRYPNSDGKRIVYQCGGDIYILESEQAKPRKIDITVHTQRPKLFRKFVSSTKYLESYSLSPQGSHMVCGARGKPFTLAHWEGPVEQLGKRDGVRYRLLRWSPQGPICVCDESGEEEIGIFLEAEEGRFKCLSKGHDIGRVLDLGLSPCGEKLWFTNHRHELFALSFPHLKTTDKAKGSAASKKALATSKKGKGLSATEKIKGEDHNKAAKSRLGKALKPSLIKVAQDKFQRIESASWSPDGLWLAYAQSVNRQDSQIFIWSWDSKKAKAVTTSPFRDWAPDFDPEGRYLYFLSCRDFDPVADNVFFEYSFPKAARPYLITLQKEQPDPFVDRPRPPGEEPRELPSPYLEESKGKKTKAALKKSQEKIVERVDRSKNTDKEPATLKKIRIDFEGITKRIRVFPIDEERYFGVVGAKGKVLLGLSAVRPCLGSARAENEQPSGALAVYDLKKLELTTPVRGVSGFDVSLDRSTVIYRSKSALRVLKIANLAQTTADRSTNREHGWIDLSRIKVSVKPLPEWQQMLNEAWRLMRDNFWDPNMANVDWKKILQQYQPLLKRLSSRHEFSDLLWEFQGELGTSHAYEWGGDYILGPQYSQGKLAATVKWDEKAKAYSITELAQGDPWAEKLTSPLALLANPLQPGDLIKAVNGNQLSQSEPPEKFLVNQAEQWVTLSVIRKASSLGKSKAKEEKAVVRALRHETPVRYRSWVEANREAVHKRSQGKLGYLHIPNMMAQGFAEFHRSYYSEVERDGLIVDVRFNGGGNVSALLLEKLSRRRLGFDIQRSGQPVPYPQESPAGPLVAITNEQAGSDGDIFSHCFKLMKLGPLLGKRTWGGTIGIWPRHDLVDGTVTTQPEFAFWFKDVGWGVENYGTDPDEEIDIRPQDWQGGIDPQLDRAVALGLELLKDNPPLSPPTTRS